MIWNQPGWDYKDIAKIFVRSGKGGRFVATSMLLIAEFVMVPFTSTLSSPQGNGCKSFHREMWEPQDGVEPATIQHGVAQHQS